MTFQVGHSYGPAAINARKTHCIRGHLLSGENLMVERPTARGRNIARRCRQCRNTAKRADLLNKKREGICRSCNREPSKAGRCEKCYERYREYFVKKQYGISLQDYKDKLKEQNNKCAICFRYLRDTKGQKALDHDHKTGKIRQFLCGRCNTAIGLFYDNPETIEAAACYLRKHNACL